MVSNPPSSTSGKRPFSKTAGRDRAIFEERDRKLEAAREERRQRRRYTPGVGGVLDKAALVALG